MDELIELKEQNKNLKKQNQELTEHLNINNKIISQFFNKNNNGDNKTEQVVNYLKSENKLLMEQIEKIKNEKDIKNLLNRGVNANELNDNKLFIYENMLQEKENIIKSLKQQIARYKINTSKNLNNKEIIKEEIYITSPNKLLNTLNDKIELYKNTNKNLKNLITELKNNLKLKEEEFNKLEEDAIKLKSEIDKCNQMKNNEEIINQLIKYQSMKAIPISQSCTDFKLANGNNVYNENNNNNDANNYKLKGNISNKKIMNEIERYERVNKTIKDITDKDFDLTVEWNETLKHCNMTQEEFLKFCSMKVTSKLTDVIEYLYKILIDKNIQIKLLKTENETLNYENIRLNKINIELEEISYNDNNIYNKIKFNNKKIIKSTETLGNDLSTYVNVDNNITHTNININMMLDYMRQQNLTTSSNANINNLTFNDNNSITSSEFKDGLLLEQINISNNNCDNTKNKLSYKKRKLKNSKVDLLETNNINQIKTCNSTDYKKLIIKNSKNQYKDSTQKSLANQEINQNNMQNIKNLNNLKNINNLKNMHNINTLNKKIINKNCKLNKSLNKFQHLNLDSLITNNIKKINKIESYNKTNENLSNNNDNNIRNVRNKTPLVFNTNYCQKNQCSLNKGHYNSLNNINFYANKLKNKKLTINKHIRNLKEISDNINQFNQNIKNNINKIKTKEHSTEINNFTMKNLNRKINPENEKIYSIFKQFIKDSTKVKYHSNKKI